MKYNWLYFFYCLAGVCLGGFVAVFLQYKGVSNTEIGIVTGIACVAAIFLTPMLTLQVAKQPRLDAKKMIIYAYIVITAIYALIAFLPLSPILVMLIYMLLYAFYLTTGPLLQVMASDYMRSGVELNFGLARGLGSVAWAIGALIFDFLVDLSNPQILVAGMVVFILITFKILASMPYEKGQTASHDKSGSILTVVRKYPIFTIMLTGFSLALAAATSIGTYLINIVTSLGGDTSFYGVAVFLMAVSEMPVMAITPRLLQRFKSIQLIGFAGACYIIRNFLICLAPNLPILCVGMLFQGLSFGMMTAVVTYYVIFNLTDVDQVSGQTLITVMTSGVGSMIGNMLGGYLQDAFGLNAMYIFIYILTLMGVCLIGIGLLLSRKQRFRKEIKR